MSEFNFSCWGNISEDTATEIGWIVDHPNDPDFDTRGNGYATAVITSLFLLTGVPWNLFVILTIVRKKLFTSPTIMLLLNLAIANLLLGVLFMPFTIITGFSGHYLFGQSDEVRCRLCQSGVLLILFPMVSIHTITVMAVDRFTYLKKPLKYHLLITQKRMFSAVVIIWIFCIVLSLPPLFGFGAIAFSYVISTCAPLIIGSTHIAPNYYYLILLAAEVVVVLSVLFVMYICIMCRIRKSIIAKFQRAMILNSADLQKSPPENETSKCESERKSAEFRLIRLFGAIVTANLFTWLPMLALILTGAIASGRIPTVLYTLAYLSYTSETVIHPILQAYLIRNVREIMTDFLKPCRKRRRVCDKNTETTM